jgi:hypothetical protein
MSNNDVQPCWLIWEHVVKPQGNVRYLRAVDMTEAVRDLHLYTLSLMRDHGKIEVEERLVNHLMGQSMHLAMGKVRRLVPPD